jgi:hypothetical protein
LEDKGLAPMEEGEEDQDAPDQDMIDRELSNAYTSDCDKIYTQMNMVLPSSDEKIEEEEIELVEI